MQVILNSFIAVHSNPTMNKMNSFSTRISGIAVHFSAKSRWHSSYSAHPYEIMEELPHANATVILVSILWSVCVSSVCLCVSSSMIMV